MDSTVLLRKLERGEKAQEDRGRPRRGPAAGELSRLSKRRILRTRKGPHQTGAGLITSANPHVM